LQNNKTVQECNYEMGYPGSVFPGGPGVVLNDDLRVLDDALPNGVGAPIQMMYRIGPQKTKGAVNTTAARWLWLLSATSQKKNVWETHNITHAVVYNDMDQDLTQDELEAVTAVLKAREAETK